VPTFDDLRLVDRDVILVRADIDISNPEAANYDENLQVAIGGVDLEFTRGWVAVDAEVCGEAYRFVNTHLEIASEPGSVFRLIQAKQMQDLLDELAVESKPILLVGDFNSSAEDVPGNGCLPDGQTCSVYVPPYMQATMGYGYLDAWDQIFWPRNGFTSSFDELVSDPTAELYERIDLVLLKPQEKEIESVVAITTGDKPFSMTPGDLWPSDHAGVVARIRFSR
jgi:exonuclease III